MKQHDFLACADYPMILYNNQVPLLQERVGPFIRELANGITKENLIEEALLSMQADGNEYLSTWKSALTDATIVLDPSKLPKIDASYDMAWQQ
jgi:hypothetical protein